MAAICPAWIGRCTYIIIIRCTYDGCNSWPYLTPPCCALSVPELIRIKHSTLRILYIIYIVIRSRHVKKNRDTVTGGSVFASGTQPPASVTKKIPVVFGVKFYCYSQTESIMEAAKKSH